MTPESDARAEFERLCATDKPFRLDITRLGEGYLYPVTDTFWQGYKQTGRYGVVPKRTESDET
jgi:hypothetical protein